MASKSKAAAPKTKRRPARGKQAVAEAEAAVKRWEAWDLKMAGLSQRQIAKRIGRSPTAVNQYIASVDAELNEGCLDKAAIVRAEADHRFLKSIRKLAGMIATNGVADEIVVRAIGEMRQLDAARLKAWGADMPMAALTAMEADCLTILVEWGGDDTDALERVASGKEAPSQVLASIARAAGARARARAGEDAADSDAVGATDTTG